MRSPTAGLVADLVPASSVLLVVVIARVVPASWRSIVR